MFRPVYVRLWLIMFTHIQYTITENVLSLHIVYTFIDCLHFYKCHTVMTVNVSVFIKSQIVQNWKHNELIHFLVEILIQKFCGDEIKLINS